MASLSLSDKLNAFLAETREVVSVWDMIVVRGWEERREDWKNGGHAIYIMSAAFSQRSRRASSLRSSTITYWTMPKGEMLTHGPSQGRH